MHLVLCPGHDQLGSQAQRRRTTGQKIFLPFDLEILRLNEDQTQLSYELEKRLTKLDGQRLWKHFQRFCEYEDLKDLYSKVVPEIAKFEEKLLGFEATIEQNQTIIRQFDENLSFKSDKIAL